MFLDIILPLPQVQRALEIVSAMSPNKKNVAEKTEKSATPNITPKKASNSSKNSLEGVPQSLLERVSVAVNEIVLLIFMVAAQLY